VPYPAGKTPADTATMTAGMPVKTAHATRLQLDKQQKPTYDKFKHNMHTM